MYSDNLYIDNLVELDNMRSGMEDTGKRELSSDFKTIEFQNVSFKYPYTDTYVLKDLSIKFENGKTYALVGSNGSGY